MPEALSFVLSEDATLMMRSALKGNFTQVQRLVQEGFDPNEIDSWGQNALDYAIEGSNQKITDYLSKHIVSGF